jgi:signal transduction histidine kinase
MEQNMTGWSDFHDLDRTLKALREENEQLRRAYTALSQQLVGLRLLQYVAQDLVSELDVDRLLKRILRSAINAVEGQAGALLLVEPGSHDLVFAVVEGGGGRALEGRRMYSDQGVAGWVVSNQQPLLVPDAAADERFYSEIPRDVNFEVKSLICAPLSTRDGVIGAIQVLNRMRGGASFQEDDLDILVSFAAQSATAIENARLYQELKRERDRLLAMEEEVRRRLARDLHDGPAQLLASAVNNVEFIQRLATREPENVSKELDSLLPLIEKALRQVRTLLFDLRPVILETQGLVPALESYVERQQGLSGLRYHLEVYNFQGRLVLPAERAIFAIVQEAVGNVRKHAWAENVWIAVAGRHGQLLVGVRDDGLGFDMTRLQAEYDQLGSLGMLNMRERAREIGGQLQLHSRPGEGTRIALTVPLRPLRAEAGADEDQGTPAG